MFKTVLLYLILSILVVLFPQYVRLIMQGIDAIYYGIAHILDPVFSYTHLGVISKKAVVLTLTPIVIIAIPALLYWFIKKAPMPYLIPITWYIWFVILLNHYIVG